MAHERDMMGYIYILYIYRNLPANKELEQCFQACIDAVSLICSKFPTVLSIRGGVLYLSWMGYVQKLADPAEHLDTSKFSCDCDFEALQMYPEM